MLKPKGTDARTVRTRAALTAAILAILGEKAFGDITIGDIAARAGISYATFFRHYSDIDSLLDDATDALIADLLELMMPALLQEDTLAASVALCRFMDERRSVCRPLLTGGADVSVRRHLIDRSIARSKTIMRRPVGLPLDLVITHSTNATLGLLAWWLDTEPEIDPDAMGAIIDRLVIGPVRRP